MYKVLVVGAGVMGRQIAAEMLLAGYEVVLMGKPTSADPTRQVKKFVSKRKDAESMSRFTYQTDYTNLDNVNFVFEAVNEYYKTKFMVLKKLDELFGPTVPITTNTSSCNIKILQEALFNHPQRFMAVHFFNPTSYLPFIEVTPTAETATQTIEQVHALFEHLPFKIKEVEAIPGFVVNRLIIALIKEAYLIHRETGLAKDDIDECCEAVLKCKPFVIDDFVGSELINIMSKNISGESIS